MSQTADASVVPSASSQPMENPPKHPLETHWSFWLRSNQHHDKVQSSWNDQQIRGHTFGTVEDFWCLVNGVRDPFEHGSSEYSVFRENLKPDYETDAFRNGGRIVLQLPLQQGKGNSSRNYDIWVHLLLAVIGENFDDVGGKYIAGLRLVTKKNSNKVEIWTVKREVEEVGKLASSVREMAEPFFENSNLSVKFSAFKGPIAFDA
eukprot:Protomagalhaensia_sp_Gyna_25__182@NODE_1089_length_2203_cov_148_218115_g864_i0_p1_GENE_NODE_1089_length_2203_cov_148_218115_g864_i0NODE_1089_length_2203_cov_148_218115_g864_i0_p1_ORF_typecomplete_len205_score30_20IF4E/PF01652_18/7_1e29_NODE_1089_length_2203_cov_148_218115_g864_i010401654